MARSRRSARDAGTRFESLVAAYLAAALGDGRIERRARCGSRDRGDVGGLTLRGRRVVVECKDLGGRLEAPAWLREAEAERGNDDAAFGVVVAKRRGVAADRRRLGAMGGQLVLMDLRTLAAIVAGGPELLEEVE